MDDLTRNTVRERQTGGWVGAAIDRVDAPLKVGGRARYAYEYAGAGAVAYGVVVGATIAKGRILRIDASAARAAPGVAMVMTHESAPPQGAFGPRANPSRFTRAKPYLASDRVRYWGEPVAFVVADSFECACAAAQQVAVEYQPDTDAAFDLRGNIEGRAIAPDPDAALAPPDSAVGDFESAYEAAPVCIDATYTTPYQHQNPMEPHASMAAWDGEQLTLHTSTQFLVQCRETLANTLQIPKSQVRIVSRYIGGGFGSKLSTEADAILSALAARQLRRPVKTALARRQMFANTTHRTASVQRVRLGADRDGRLTAIAHESWQQTASFDEFMEPTVACTRSLYAAPNRLTKHRLVPLDLPIADSMRAPGEAIGLLTFEAAMDELAHALDLDPIALRLRNDTQQHPEKGVPFSSRNLAACLNEGARRFGWDRRPRRPASRREGNVWIGYGVAAAIRSNYLRPAQARVRLNADGTALAQLAMTDIGTGTYTILTQIAAEGLGLPPERVHVELGDTDFPPAPGSGGSFGATSSGSALHQACAALRQHLAQMLCADPRSPLHGGVPGDVRFEDGHAVGKGGAEPLTEALARLAPQGVQAEGSSAPGDAYQKYAQDAFGAHFAEVRVDVDTGEVRLARMLGVFAAGRILNPKTARSQLIGGMIWGLGSALTEESVVDPNYGLFVNHDLAEYHLIVNADTADIDAVFIDEYDAQANVFGAKGLGELGICGAGAAVNNAVFNATGVRVRDYPMTLDKVLAGLEAQSAV
jgi:xanthine dehydrogenase YagR molybdenum-binding subunit